MVGKMSVRFAKSFPTCAIFYDLPSALFYYARDALPVRLELMLYLISATARIDRNIIT